MRAFILVLLLILVFFHTRGVITHDEGYILQSSLRFLNGEIPYKDFHFAYTPGSIFLTSLSFLLFSPSILSSRILMILISLITSVLIYRTIFLSTRNKLYSFLAVFMYIAWGPTHINFAWPVMFCIPLGILVCYLFLKFIETPKERFLFLAGITVFLLFLFKQNFGVAGIVATFLFFLTYRKAQTLSTFLTFAYGFIWSGILFSLYLFVTNSFVDFFNDLYFFTFNRILIQGGLDTPFIFYDIPLKTFARALLYLSPLIASIASIALIIIRRRYILLFISAFVLSFYIVGIRPTTDYIHLVPLLSLIGIPLVFFLRFNTFSTIRIVTIVGIIGLTGLGFYTALFKGYYRWDEPLFFHSTFYSDSRVNIFVSDKTKNDFSKFINVIDANSKKGDYILINSYAPMYYFISKRLEPTRNNYVTYDVNRGRYEYEVILALSRKHIPLIILPKQSIEPINAFIKSTYTYLDSFGDYEVYKQK